MSKIYMDSNGRFHSVDSDGLDTVIGEAGAGFLRPVLAIQYDQTLDPGVSPSAGDRYLITDRFNLHANFGSIGGLGDNDIVEYVASSGFKVSYDVSQLSNDEGGIFWCRSDNSYRYYTGTSWLPVNKNIWASAGAFARYDDSTFYKADSALLSVNTPLRYSASLVGGWVYGLIMATYLNTHNGTAQAGGLNTIDLAPTADGNPGFYVGQVIKIVSGTSANDVRRIIGYTGGPSNTATVDSNWTAVPDVTSVYEIHNTFEVCGAPMDITHQTYLQFRGSAGIFEKQLIIPGVWGAVGSVTNLLQLIGKTFYRWKQSTANIVRIALTTLTPDSGGVQPRVNLRIRGNALSSDGSNNGIQISPISGSWVESGININTTNYQINDNDPIEVSTDGGGMIGDAADLTIVFTAIIED